MNKYEQLSKEQLIFLLEELTKREEKNKKSLEKYHKSDKGTEARKRAWTKYNKRINSNSIDFECDCGKKLKNKNLEKHLTTKYHLVRINKITPPNPPPNTPSNTPPPQSIVESSDSM